MNQNVKTPTSSRFKVLLVGLLPYAYVFTVLALILLPFVFLIRTIISGENLNGAVARIEMALVVVSALFARSIWVRVVRPEGKILRRNEEAPALFSMLREIERKLGGPRVHGIEFTDEFNISMALIPQLSLFSWPVRRYLRIGLPLMEALSPEQFKAILAQELARYGGTRDRLGSWINARHLTWHRLWMALELRRSLGPWLFRHFFKLYVPGFHRYSIALVRQHEFAADQAAAEVTSAEAIADALIRTRFGTYLEERFWDETDVSQTTDDPDIPELLQTRKSNEAEEWLNAELYEKTHPFGLDPALKDRLEALGQKPRVPAPIEESAAVVFLSDRLEEVRQRLKEKRREKIGGEPEKSAPVSRDLNELMSRSQEPDFTAFESLELGQQLLAKDEEEGVAYIERAMEANSDLTSVACFYVSRYYERRGNLVTANRYSRRSSDYSQLTLRALAERAQVSLVDRFVSQTLAEEEIERLRTEIAKHGEIKAAYLVRKEVRYLSDKPHHALGLVFERPWVGREDDDLAFTKRLPQTTTNPSELYAFVLDYRNRRVRKLIRNTPSALIYQRD